MERIATHCQTGDQTGDTAAALAPRVLHRVPPSHRRDRAWSRDREPEPRERAYRLGVVSLQVRRTRFARFVDRALRDAQARGMSTAAIEAATGVGSSTYYRWRKGEWREDPQLGHVKSFCVGLGADLGEAYRALDWQTDDRPATEPQPFNNPILHEAARLLSNPRVPPHEKAMVEEMIRVLNARMKLAERDRVSQPLPVIPMPSEDYGRERRGRR